MEQNKEEHSTTGMSPRKGIKRVQEEMAISNTMFTMVSYKTMNKLIHQYLQRDYKGCMANIIISFFLQRGKPIIRDGLRFAQSGGIKFPPCTRIYHSFWVRSWGMREYWQSEIGGRNGKRTIFPLGAGNISKIKAVNIPGCGNHSTKNIREHSRREHRPSGPDPLF